MPIDVRDVEAERQGVIQLLERTLVEAHEGKIDNLLMAVRKGDQYFLRSAGRGDLAEDVGSLELLKYEVIRRVNEG